jgi:hypothetical protein
MVHNYKVGCLVASIRKYVFIKLTDAKNCCYGTVHFHTGYKKMLVSLTLNSAILSHTNLLIKFISFFFCHLEQSTFLAPTQVTFTGRLSCACHAITEDVAKATKEDSRNDYNLRPIVAC